MRRSTARAAGHNDLVEAGVLFHAVLDGPLDESVPVGGEHVVALCKRHKAQRAHHADPEANEPHVQVEAARKRDRQRENVVAHEIEPAADVLAALATQHAAADTGDGVVHLVRGADDQDLAGKLDDLGVAREAGDDCLAETHEQRGVDRAKEHRHPRGRVRRLDGGVLGRRADEPGHSGRRGDRDGERDLVDGRAGRGHDGLRRERGGAELGRRKRDDLEREPLGLDHDHAGARELQSAAPVAEDVPREAAPALVAVDKRRVAEEHRRHAPVGDHDGGGGPQEPDPVRLVPHQLVVQNDVERRAQHEHKRRRVENALRLEVLLEHLEHDVARHAVQQSFQVRRGQLAQPLVLDDFEQQRPRPPVQKRVHRHVQQQQQHKTPQAVHAHRPVVFSAICLRTQRRQRRRDSLDDGVRGHVAQQVRQRHGGQLLRAEVAHAENRRNRERELEQERDHQRDRAHRKQAELLPGRRLDLQDDACVGRLGGDEVERVELRHGRLHRRPPALDVVLLVDRAVLMERLVGQQRDVVGVGVRARGGPPGRPDRVHEKGYIFICLFTVCLLGKAVWVSGRCTVRIFGYRRPFPRDLSRLHATERDIAAEYARAEDRGRVA
ncbi:hypothetical protein KL930_004326 [Ogataea haglerorum]|nr:hypothetical protein KL951_004317 [Ogataea haglerorum]KAG7773813.1 hypothetical protein KL930_004326 [Ogataea haglerorum]KAG7776563.1 hypothetical protein KL922_003639 [Ogataea haglerorum]